MAQAYVSISNPVVYVSMIWLEHTRARITASKIHTACHTSITSPFQSLVNQILTVGSNVDSAAIVWGIQSEEVAVQEFQQNLFPNHTSFEIKFTGLHGNPKFPHMGASPDGLVSCECCVEGHPEIKCLYSI